MLGISLVNSFHATGLFLIENKENHWFYEDFQGCKRDQWHDQL